MRVLARISVMSGESTVRSTIDRQRGKASTVFIEIDIVSFYTTDWNKRTEGFETQVYALLFGLIQVYLERISQL